MKLCPLSNPWMFLVYMLSIEKEFGRTESQLMIKENLLFGSKNTGVSCFFSLACSEGLSRPSKGTHLWDTSVSLVMMQAQPQVWRGISPSA